MLLRLDGPYLPVLICHAYACLECMTLFVQCNLLVYRFTFVGGNIKLFRSLVGDDVPVMFKLLIS